MAEEDIEEQQEPQSEPEGFAWASATDIPVIPYEDIPLPLMRRKVRVRFLTQEDAVRLGHLPELARFQRLIAERMLEAQSDDDKDTELPEADLIARMEMMETERTTYGVLVAHFCVMQPDAKVSDIRGCSDCGLEHPPSLWTKAQANLLQGADINRILYSAEQTRYLEELLPFSKAPAPSDTPESPGTGASTPETTSSEPVPQST